MIQGFYNDICDTACGQPGRPDRLRGENLMLGPRRQ